jgi:hypothetical protein
VDNRAVDDEVLPGHRAGYSGLASLSHAKRPANAFVPAFAGLNFEHIHDGTVREREVLFEPRNAPMQLRVIDQYTCELYQAPTPNWKLESCHRFHLLEDGTIEMTFECIPRRDTYANGYIGLFWASYIHQPESLDIHFMGWDEDELKRDDRPAPHWVRGVTPSHGVRATHLALDDDRTFEHAADFPLSLAFNHSTHRFAQPWYYGVSHGMAFAPIFRERDQPRLTQSPSGGGQGNPAWDFQYFIRDYEIGRRYQFVMRAVYVPFESGEQVARIVGPHVGALNRAE